MINELKLFKADLRAATVVYSGVGALTGRGFRRGMVIVENGLDQDTTCQLQGKPISGDVWQDVGAAVVVTKATGSSIVIAETALWGELRVKCTPAGIPTTGTIQVWLERAL